MKMDAVLKNCLKFMCVAILVTIVGCGGNDDPAPNPLSLLSAKVNGATLTNGATNVPVNAQLEFVFSATLDIPKFEAAVSITGVGNPSYTIAYANASSKAILTFSDLAYNSTYNLQISAGNLGSNGQSLSSNIDFSFTTMEDGKVREMAPCTSVSNDCYQTVNLQDAAQKSGNLGFYSTYPIYLENAEWEKLKYAIIVIHGANRDADNYFNWLLNPLNSEGLLENTILISPEFKSNTTAANNDLYWNNDWREGQKSTSAAKIGSFEAVDALLERLSDKTVFPVLEKVIVTGHSSGGLFTQVYGATNVAEPASNLSFEYVVVNSQYFYYPDNQRYDEQTNQFFTPTGCGSYNSWPLGYSGAPSYVTTRTEAEIDANLLGRSFTYFLGNGTGNDSALNTNDCGAVLLGSSRFKRGEHIFEWLQTQYSGQNNSSKVVVNGIGHDGQGMYQSNDFKMLLGSILE